jgi:putative transposase
MHPYLEKYFCVIQHNNYDKQEALAFLRMVRLKERKLEWAFKQKEKGVNNSEIYPLLGIKKRRFQKLYAEYKMTGNIPELNWKRRPVILLSDEEKSLIDKAVKESKLYGAVHLELYIKKYYQKRISHNKIHNYLLRKGISKEDKEKQKQRIYRLYERDHSFSLGHLDWHVSKCIPGKQVCVFIDDASRKIIAGDEYDNALEIYAIDIVKQSIKIAFKEYSSVIREINTDKGSQFYANRKDIDGEKGKTDFELFLENNNIVHIPSRRNHPQTNGKNERWFRTYEENRMKFKTFKEFIDWYNNKIHLGLSRKEGITPNEAIGFKLQPGCVLGLFFRRFE